MTLKSGDGNSFGVSYCVAGFAMAEGKAFTAKIAGKGAKDAEALAANT